MKKFSKTVLWLLVAAACAMSFTLTSCEKKADTDTDDGVGTVLEQTDDTPGETTKSTESEADTEPAPELTDELPREFDEDDIRDEIRDKIIYGEYNELNPLYSEEYNVDVTYAQGYVNEFKVIARGTITDRVYSFDFDAEFERIINNWELTKIDLTYNGDGPRGFDIKDAELKIESRLGYDADITGYTENEDGSYTITYNYVNTDLFAPICTKYSGSTAKYLPYEYCTDVWYIDECINGVSSHAYMDATYGDFSLTDGNVTINFTLAADAVDFYNEYKYYNLDYTATLGEGTVHTSFATVIPTYDEEFKDWDNRDVYLDFWHTFTFDIGTDYYEFAYRAYKNNSELSGWYLEDVKLTEVK